MLTIDEMLAPAAVQATAERTFTFNELRGEPQLTVVQATKANRAWFNEVLAADHRDDTPIRTAAQIEASQLEDAKLYARHCIRAWRVREAGPDTPYVERPYDSLEGARFLEALIVKVPREWTRLLKFLQDERNFTARAIDARATAGNSSGG
jgi:hypothetical protein